ncbi:MAG: cation diffusion facilitator family transporter [Nitrosomonas sp.]|uniref:cation diffusion facilitator family transporter n=1 Tax=Nitrosomonas sp. TaxID=42353 RepID=UPI00273043E0|nr:cation diffusion facilitator family transporter [Nitrosomonas sp.]MDP1549064.1 cation diffusion facilitator family transporter [Nitrosomonas sp.]
MAHNHSHDHDHSHVPKNFDRAFAIGIALNLGFVVVEVVFGLFANSLALLADAGHNLSDVLSLLFAWGASVLVRKLPTQRHTYGLRRTSILAALINALVLLVAVGAIAWEAILRFGHPEALASDTVIWVASVGIVINGFTAWLFMSGQKQDMNIRGAYLHMMADAAVSLGVVLAAITIKFTDWLWLDPVMSLVVAVIIGIDTWGLLRESLSLALDAVPANIHPAKVEAYLASLPGIEAVHDLHIWAMSTTEIALTVHLIKPDAVIDDLLLVQINNELRDLFGIQHTTVQFERGDTSYPCKQAPAEVV